MYEHAGEASSVRGNPRLQRTQRYLNVYIYIPKTFIKMCNIDNI